MSPSEHPQRQQEGGTKHLCFTGEHQASKRAVSAALGWVPKAPAPRAAVPWHYCDHSVHPHPGRLPRSLAAPGQALWVRNFLPPKIILWQVRAAGSPFSGVRGSPQTLKQPHLPLTHSPCSNPCQKCCLQKSPVMTHQSVTHQALLAA